MKTDARFIRAHHRTMSLSVIIPSCTDVYLDRCLRSIERRGDGSEQVIVVDSGLSVPCMKGWRHRAVFIPARLPFVFAQAINDGVAAARPNDDLLLLNDDTEMLTSDFSSVIQSLLDEPDYGRVGMIGLKIYGGCGNPDQREVADSEPLVSTERVLCFVAVVIRRKAWEQIGPMDEQYIAYGFDDDDMCLRAVRADWYLGATGLAAVAHGWPPYPHSSTYKRDLGTEEWGKAFDYNKEVFLEKWGRGVWFPGVGTILT